jgi:Zn-finger nucleic acid-binding protein
VNLIDSERLGVRAGYCPECEGEWFARGAVDQLIDRAEHGGGPGDHPGAALTHAAECREGLWNWF